MTAEILPGLATPHELRGAPTLDDCIDGVICDDPWTVAYRDSYRTFARAVNRKETP